MSTCIRFAVLSMMLLCLGCGRAPEQWNVVIVTFDTTRADHIGCYGKGDARTPTIDKLAREGVVFEHAYSPIPITAPSHSTMMTGKVPFAHGVRDNGLFVLDDKQTTLAEILKEQGYKTGAAIGAFPLTSQFGLDQGFDVYEDHLSVSYNDFQGNRVLSKRKLYFDERKAGRVNEAIIPWLRDHHKKPFFLWAHYFDPHHPHEPPFPYHDQFRNDLYSGEIAYADECLGVLIGELKRLGVYENTLLIFTADHGEGRGEHQETTHSLLLYNATLHVPLVIRDPEGRRGERVTERVGLVDIFPTVLDMLKVDVPDEAQGRSLLGYLRSGTSQTDPDRAYYAETLSPRFSNGWGELRAIYADDYKYIHGPRPELYRISDDPREIKNRIHTEPGHADELRARLEDYLVEHEVDNAGGSVGMNNETKQKLMALGYLSGSSGDTSVDDERLRDDGVAPQDRVADVSAISGAKNAIFRGQPLLARELLMDLMTDDPDNPAYMRYLATAEAQLGRFDEALVLLNRLLKADFPVAPPAETLMQIAQLHLLTGDIETAVDKARESTLLDETSAGLYFRAKIHERLGQTDEEVSSLRLALKIDPKYVPARIDLAIRLAESGDIDTARREFNQALADEPYFARTWYNHGVFLLNNENRADAATSLRRAVELDPHYLKARYALVVLYTDDVDKTRAGECLAELLKIARNSELAMRAEQHFYNTWPDG